MTNWSSLRGHRDIVTTPTPGAPNGADGQPLADHYQVNSSSSMMTGGKKRNQKDKGKGRGIKKQCLPRVTGGEESVGELTVEHRGKNLTDQINRRMCKVKERLFDWLRNRPEVTSIVNQTEEKWPLQSELQKIKEKNSEIQTEFKAGRLNEDGANQKMDELKERLSHVDGQLQEFDKAINVELNKLKKREAMFLKNEVNSSSSMMTGGKKRNRKDKGKGRGIKKQCLVTGGEESVGELTVEHRGKTLTDQINRRMCKVKERLFDWLRNRPEVTSIVNQTEEKWPLQSELQKIKEKNSEIQTEFKAGRLNEDGANQKIDELKERLSHVDGQLQEFHKANNVEKLNKLKKLEAMFLKNEEYDVETLQKEYYSVCPHMKEVVATDDHGSLVKKLWSKMNELENEIYTKNDNKVNVRDSIGSQQALNKNFDTGTDTWVKAVQVEPHDNKGEDVEGGDSVPPPAQAPPQYPIFSAGTSAILNALGSLRDDISGIRDEVRGLGARMSALEERIAHLPFQFCPPQPPQDS